MAVCTNVVVDKTVLPLDNVQRAAIAELGLSLNDEVQAHAMQLSGVHLSTLLMIVLN